MESVYAALLLNKASKKITEVNLEKILTAAGVTADKNQLKTLVAGLEGKNIEEIIASASAAPVIATAAPAAAGKGKKAKKKTKKKETKKKEAEPSGIGALFG
jgi:large subunit ribosomal protein L12